MDPSSYQPLMTSDQETGGADNLDAVPQRNNRRNVIIYSVVTLAVITTFAAILYFLIPHHRRSSSSSTVTIVNRFADDISVYEIDAKGAQRILAHLGPNELIRVVPEKDTKCFVRHHEEYFSLEQMKTDHDGTAVIGSGAGTDSSVDGGAVKQVTFINDEDEPVDVAWVDFAGHQVKMSTLKPAEHFTIDTFVSHVFIMTSTDSQRAIGRFTVRPDVVEVRTQPIVHIEDYPIRIAIENKTKRPAKLMWKDGDEDKILGRLEAGERSILDTFAGHELYFEDYEGDRTKSTIMVPSITCARVSIGDKN